MESLSREGFEKIKIISHEEIGEIIPLHYEVKVGLETIAYIYKPIACHSYNKITVGDKEVLVATIDTILAFYFSFLYVNNKYYNKDRLLCMAKFLFEVENKNRLAQIGLLKRFSINCYGKQMTLEDIRSEKAEKYKELSNVKGTKAYDMWFLKYVPAESNKKKQDKPIRTNLIEKENSKIKVYKKTEKKPISLYDILRRKQTRKNK